MQANATFERKSMCEYKFVAFQYRFVAFKYIFVAFKYKFVVVKRRLTPWLSHFAPLNIEI